MEIVFVASMAGIADRENLRVREFFNKRNIVFRVVWEDDPEGKELIALAEIRHHKVRLPLVVFCRGEIAIMANHPSDQLLEGIMELWSLIGESPESRLIRTTMEMLSEEEGYPNNRMDTTIHFRQD